MDQKQLNQIYKKNSSGAYIIEISLNHYSELFNSWDAAPFKNKDLDYELKVYLEECSFDIPLRHKIQIWLYLPKKQRNKTLEKNAISGLKNYFRLTILDQNRNIFKQRKNIFSFFSSAIIFWTMAIPLQKFATDNFLLELLSEGLFLGGWVMGWELFSLIIFQRRELRHKLKSYQRFQDSKIEFKYR